MLFGVGLIWHTNLMIYRIDREQRRHYTEIVGILNLCIMIAVCKTFCSLLPPPPLCVKSFCSTSNTNGVILPKFHSYFFEWEQQIKSQ